MDINGNFALALTFCCNAKKVEGTSHASSRAVTRFSPKIASNFFRCVLSHGWKGVRDTELAIDFILCNV